MWLKFRHRKNCTGDFNYYFSILHSVGNYCIIIEPAIECLVHGNCMQMFTHTMIFM